MKKTLALVLALTVIFALCAVPFASAEETSVLSSWADDLFEPETSVTYPATIVWPADASAVETAAQAVRPNTMIVAVDSALKVSTLAGEPISDDLAAYLCSVKGTTLAAMYISDAATADAVSAFAAENALADVFVVASAANAGYVKQVCDANAGVLGIVDWTGEEVDISRECLNNIVKTTNASHAKIAIVPEVITADYDSVEYLRAMLVSVWGVAAADDVSVYTALTNGVNGVVCADYMAVVNALESFDGSTALLRHVFITGHRGLPSQYIENTIRSERAAINAGANVIECDVSMSADGVLFVLHDDDAKRLFNYYEVDNIEDLTIAQIQALKYDMNDYGIPGEDAEATVKNSVLNANNTNRTTKGREDTVLSYDPTVDHIPTLREYFEALDDENIFHFVEIKSYNPGIVAPIRDLCREMGMDNRMCIITFNDGWGHFSDGAYDASRNVMQAMAEEWPDMALGYLGAGKYYFTDLNAVEAEQGIGAAVGTLYSYLQPLNSTYHDYNVMQFGNVVFAARHRGLTSWAWTYNDETLFAKDYLFGGTYSMTTNFSTWATDLPVQISASDMEIGAEGDIVRCLVSAQDGSVLINQPLSLVQISGVPVSMDENGVVTGSEAGEAVVMVKLESVLDINGVDLSAAFDATYSIYSNPFVITVK